MFFSINYLIYRTIILNIITNMNENYKKQEDQEITPELQAQMEEINQLLAKPQIEPTQALNIIINAVQVCYDTEVFNDLDKMLISKALTCFQQKIESNENFEIKVSEN